MRLRMEPSEATRPPTVTCIGATAARCERVVAALPVRLPADRSPLHLEIGERRCDGPCFPAGVEGWMGGLEAEFVDGGEPFFLVFEVVGEEITWEVVPIFSERVIPRSTRVGGTTAPLTFDHCVLAGGIDVDGSFWDVVGALSWEQVDRFAFAEARFTRTSDVEALLAFGDGLTVVLARHRGPSYLPGCDRADRD